jgi:predicted metal-binding protein
MKHHTKLGKIFEEYGYADYKWIEPGKIVVSQWVRMKCSFGCSNYGRNASCPPNVPPVSECRRFFDEYNDAAVLHFEKKVEKPEDRHAWSKGVNQGLLKLEKAVFLSGYPKAFLLFMDSCNLCTDCAGKREECKNPVSARPSPEAMAVDVFSTVKQYGYPIEVLSDTSQTMNRYAFLLIE